MSFSPTRGSENTLITIQGLSLYSTSGIYLVSGVSRASGIIVSTSNSFVTFYPPSLTDFGQRSGVLQVYNSFGNSTSSTYLTLLDPLKVTSFSPSSGATGVTKVRILGSGMRDVTGLYFGDFRADFTNYLDGSTWVVSGTVPFVGTAGLPQYVPIIVMHEGASATGAGLFCIKETTASFTGLYDVPDSINAEQYLRGNSSATALEWQTPSGVLNSISGVKNYGDSVIGDYTFSGNFKTTGYSIHNTGVQTGIAVIDSIVSGGYLITRMKIGGIEYRMSSLKYS